MRQVHNINYIWLFICLIVVPGHAVGLNQENTKSIDRKKTAFRKVVARVNNNPIYDDQLNATVKSDLAKFRRYGMRKEDPNLVKRLQRRTLDKLIGDELIYQESRKLTIEDIDTKVEQEFKSLEKKYGRGKGMEKYLKMNHLTAEKVRESLKARIRVDEYLKKQGILEPDISEKQIRQAYEDNPDSYSRAESIKVSHILIAIDSNAGTEAKEEARKKAEQIREEILGGKDFAEMARKYSDCKSASDGGCLNYIRRGYMPEEFDKVAFAMEKEELSDLVKTRFGYHIIKVLDKKPAGKIPYEQVRSFIKKFLQEKESKKKLATHIENLKNEARIELFLTD